MLIHRLATLTGIAVVTLFLAAPANALTMAECSTKYNAAKDAGTLGGQNWNQFRKAQCGTDATAAAQPADTTNAATATDDDAAPGLTAKECSTKYQAAKAAGTLNGMKWNDFRKTQCAADATAAAQPAATTKAAAAAADDAAPGLTAKECSTKYQAAKAAGTLNGMKWNDFRKSECAAGATAAAQPAAAPAEAATAAATDTGKGLSMADCSAKYQAAKAGNTLNGMKWNDFRKSQCGAGAADDDDTLPAPDAKYTGDPQAPTITAPQGVKFPAAISPKYATETPAKGRMHTCLDLYYANKDANTLGGLRWIQKGGGFYSLCNAKLKS